MYIRVNEEVLRIIQKEEFRGKTSSELKPHYIEQNAFFVDLDMPVYRIFQLDSVILKGRS